MKLKNFFNSSGTGPRQFLTIIAGTLLTLVCLTVLLEINRSKEKISYTTFFKNVEDDKVKSVVVAGQQVTGVFKDGQKGFETMVPDNNPQQWEILKAHNVDLVFNDAASPFSGWYVFIMAFFLFLGALVWFLLKQSKGSGNSGGNIFSMGKSRAKMIVPTQVKVNFSQVAGAQEAKNELTDIVEFLKNPEKYSRLGAKLPRGILLVGEPGNGKTLLAKAVAGEANCPFFMVSGSDFVEVFVGVGAARIRDLFNQARKVAPCIIFIDEIDAIGRQRGAGLGGGNDEREQTLNQLLTEMDGFDNQGVPVIVLAATNIPDVLDKALMRPGRFDQRIEVPFPDLKARQELVAITTRHMNLANDVDIYKIAQETAGFSGADLANLINNAALIASKKNRFEITAQDIEEARLKIFRSQDTQNKSGGSQTRSAARTKIFMPSQIKTKFADVAGAYEAKEEVVDIVDFLKDPAKFKRLGAKVPKGVLLIGEPGNGKTLLARAIAGEANCPFMSVSGSDFIEMYVGVGASRVRELFAQARKHAPCIIFIDEIDTIGSQRNAGASHHEHDQTLNQLLSEMDGFESPSADVIVIGATNRVDILDKALLRPGRFDRRVVVPYPSLKAREEILQVHARNVICDPTVNFEKIARGTPGFSGADLENLINEAAIMASKLNQPAVTARDFDEARDKIIIGKEMRSVIMSPKEVKITAYHEAGHALVSLLLPEVSEPLFKVTITPRGSSLGATHWLPEREKYLRTKEEMLASIMAALGGRIAEEIEFNVLSTGAAGDFAAATDTARRMVCDYGMSENLGPMIYDRHGRQGQEISQDTIRKIDDEIRSIVQECYDKAKNLLLANRDKLEKLAQLLLQKETVDAQEVYELLDIAPRVDLKIN